MTDKNKLSSGFGMQSGYTSVCHEEYTLRISLRLNVICFTAGGLMLDRLRGRHTRSFIAIAKSVKGTKL